MRNSISLIVRESGTKDLIGADAIREHVARRLTRGELPVLRRRRSQLAPAVSAIVEQQSMTQRRRAPDFYLVCRNFGVLMLEQLESGVVEAECDIVVYEV